MNVPFLNNVTLQGVLSTAGGTSTNWNTAYTNLVSNSAAYLLSGTEVNLGDIPALSGNWNTAYTNLVTNSAAYLLSGGDADWRGIGRIQFIQDELIVNLDANQYNIFVVTVDQPTLFTYSNFISGQTIHVYLSAAHSGHVAHVFPENTFFSELGDNNIIYSFDEYVTRIMLQNIGNQIMNFSSLIRVVSGGVPPYSEGAGGINSGLL